MDNTDVTLVVIEARFHHQYLFPFSFYKIWHHAPDRIIAPNVNRALCAKMKLKPAHLANPIVKTCATESNSSQISLRCVLVKINIWTAMKCHVLTTVPRRKYYVFYACFNQSALLPRCCTGEPALCCDVSGCVDAQEAAVVVVLEVDTAAQSRARLQTAMLVEVLKIKPACTVAKAR